MLLLNEIVLTPPANRGAIFHSSRRLVNASKLLILNEASVNLCTIEPSL